MMDYQIPEQFDTPLVRQAVEIWHDGGWAMLAIAGVGVVLFAVGVMTYIRLMGKRFEWSWRSSMVIAILAYIVGFVGQIGGSDLGETAVAMFETLPIVALAALENQAFHVLVAAGVLWWIIGSLPKVDIASKYAGFLIVGGYLAVFMMQAVSQWGSFQPFIVSVFTVAVQAFANMNFMIGFGAAVLWALLSLAWAYGVSRWPTWVNHPESAKGAVGRLVKFAMLGNDIDETAKRFDEMRVREIKPFDREMLVMRVCIAAAPLLGLLGTVTGMVATFDALNMGSGGDETQQLVSDGISVALITTETGLVIALSGLFFQYQLAQKHQRYKAFIAHMETLCTQAVYHKNLKKQA